MKIAEFQNKLRDDSILSSGMTFKQDFLVFSLERKMISDDIIYKYGENDTLVYEKIWSNGWERSKFGVSYEILLGNYSVIVENLYKDVVWESMDYRSLIYLKCKNFNPYNPNEIPNLKKELGWDGLYNEKYSNISLNTNSKKNSLSKIADLLNVNSDLFN